jgi:hypothetical protein
MIVKEGIIKMDWDAFVAHVSERLNAGATLQQLSEDVDGCRFRWTGVIHSMRLSINDELLRPMVSVELPTKWITISSGEKIKCNIITVGISKEDVCTWEKCNEGQEVDFSFVIKRDLDLSCVRKVPDVSGGKRLSLSCFDGMCECEPRSSAKPGVRREEAPSRIHVCCKIVRERRNEAAKNSRDLLLGWSQEQVNGYFRIHCQLPDIVDVDLSILRDFWRKVFESGIPRCDSTWHCIIVDLGMDIGEYSAHFYHLDLKTVEAVSVSMSAPKLAVTDLVGRASEFEVSINRREYAEQGTAGLLMAYYRILFAPLMERWADELLDDLAKRDPRKRILGCLDSDLGDLAEFVWDRA